MVFKKHKYKTIFPDRDGKKFHLFHWTYEDLVQALVKRILEQKDNTILVTGKTGVGKSTLVGKLCFQKFAFIESPKVPGKMMYEDDNYMVDPEIFAARIAKDKGIVDWLDESLASLSRRNWHSKINNLIVKRKNTNRKNGVTSFVVLPYELEVDKNFLKHITMWIWVYKRGHAQVFVAGNHKKGGSSLDIEKIVAREEKWWKENPNAKMCFPRIHSEYVGNIVFGAFTKEEQKRYDALVEKHSSSGKLSEEEEELLKDKTEEVDKEKMIPDMLDAVERGEVKTKREMWDTLKEQTGFSDALLVRHLNRHLKIRGLKSFNSFEI